MWRPGSTTFSGAPTSRARTGAAEQGAAVARNALDPQNSKLYGTVPYFWSDWYDNRIQFFGSPDADEAVFVDGDVEHDRRWMAPYRSGGRLIGALTVNGQAEIMKYRGLTMKQVSWDEALQFAAQRKALAAAKRSAA